MVQNVRFATTRHYNFDYLWNKISRMRKELVAVKKHVEKLAVESQRLSSQRDNTTEWKPSMNENLGPMEDTMA